MAITSDEVNFLVYRYLQESGATCEECNEWAAHVAEVLLSLPGCIVSVAFIVVPAADTSCGCVLS